MTIVTTDYTTTIDSFSVIGREDQDLDRTINELIYIRVNSPTLSKNIGKYHMPHKWDEDMFKPQNKI